MWFCSQKSNGFWIGIYRMVFGFFLQLVQVFGLFLGVHMVWCQRFLMKIDITSLCHRVFQNLGFKWIFFLENGTLFVFDFLKF